MDGLVFAGDSDRRSFLMRRTILMGSVAIALAAATSWSATAATQTPVTRAAVGNIQHGEYLVHHVAMCVECHSPRDEGDTIIPGSEFMGAPLPVRTPAHWATRAPRNRGLPGYDDEQAMRLLTEGAIARDGRQLLPPMPRFRMTHQDAADIISFLRSLK